jgi:Glycosyl transferases group 1
VKFTLVFSACLASRAEAGRASTPPLLRVCGGIRSVMRDASPNGVEFVGVVDDLRTYYDECDLVLLPIVTGGGVAIKTLEAVLYERAVLATRHALRGLPDDVVTTIGLRGRSASVCQDVVGHHSWTETAQGRVETIPARGGAAAPALILRSVGEGRGFGAFRPIF